MVRWEYFVERFRTDKFHESMMDLVLAGKDGWELVSVAQAEMKEFATEEDQAWILFFKRPKED